MQSEKLSEKLNTCRMLMEEVSRNKVKDQENENIAKKNNTFFDAYQNIFCPLLKSYIATLELSDYKITASLVKELVNCIDDSKKTFVNQMVIDANKYSLDVKKLNNKFAEEWEKITSENLVEIKENLGILKLVCNNKTEIQSVLYCLNSISKWPVSNETIEQFTNAKKRAEEILEDMEFDDEIEEFLRKVKDKQASLLDLTDPIISWIRKENLSGNIMISIK